MFKKFAITFAVLSSVLISGIAAAQTTQNSSGYETISELKVFGDDWLQVYFTNGQTHTCGSLSTRWIVPNTSENQIRLLHSAFLAGRGVSLQYQCVSGAARVTGVRVR